MCISWILVAGITVEFQSRPKTELKQRHNNTHSYKSDSKPKLIWFICISPNQMYFSLKINMLAQQTVQQLRSTSLGFHYWTTWCIVAPHHLMTQRIKFLWIDPLISIIGNKRRRDAMIRLYKTRCFVCRSSSVHILRKSSQIERVTWRMHRIIVRTRLLFLVVVVIVKQRSEHNNESYLILNNGYKPLSSSLVVVARCVPCSTVHTMWSTMDVGIGTEQ